MLHTDTFFHCSIVKSQRSRGLACSWCTGEKVRSSRNEPNQSACRYQLHTSNHLNGTYCSSLPQRQEGQLQGARAHRSMQLPQSRHGAHNPQRQPTWVVAWSLGRENHNVMSNMLLQNCSASGKYSSKRYTMPHSTSSFARDIDAACAPALNIVCQYLSVHSSVFNKHLYARST